MFPLLLTCPSLDPSPSLSRKLPSPAGATSAPLKRNPGFFLGPRLLFSFVKIDVLQLLFVMLGPLEPKLIPSFFLQLFPVPYPESVLRSRSVLAHLQINRPSSPGRQAAYPLFLLLYFCLSASKEIMNNGTALVQSPPRPPSPPEV